MTAVIMAFNMDVRGREIGRVEMEEDRVVIKANEPWLREDLLSGVTLGGKTLTTADGEQFIQALPAKYTGSMVRARLI